MRVDLLRGHRSGNHHLYGWVISTRRRQLFIGIKIEVKA
jgi:hypothetical protein